MYKKRIKYIENKIISLEKDERKYSKAKKTNNALMNKIRIMKRTASYSNEWLTGYNYENIKQPVSFIFAREDCFENSESIIEIITNETNMIEEEIEIIEESISSKKNSLAELLKRQQEYEISLINEKESGIASIELEKEQIKIDLIILKQKHELEIMKEKTKQEELKYLREQAQLKGIHGNIQNIKDFHKKG